MGNILLLRPRLSEQTYALAQGHRVYVFDVPKTANKHDVARAVAAQFSVVVTAVNMTNYKGKAKRTISLTGRRQGIAGVRSDSKKAYVRLAEGNSLPLFAAVEEAEKKEQVVQEKVEKAAAKQAQQVKKQPNATKATPRRGLRILNRKGEK